MKLIVNAALAALLAQDHGGKLPDGYELNERVPVLPAPSPPSIVHTPAISARNQRRLEKKRARRNLT